MPELPENEAQRLTLERTCLNRTVEAAELGDNITHIDLPGDNELGRLKGRQFTETRRHGKNIFLGSKTGPWITVHLGMSGWLIPYDLPESEPDHTKFRIVFEGDRRLAFRCPRKLGHVKVIEDPDAYIAAKKLGPDALSIERNTFVDFLGGSKAAIKSALMDQNRIAGIGNLWSDEILFQTGLDPARKGSDLKADRLDTVFDAMLTTLSKGVVVEADYSRLPDDWLIPNRKSKSDCPRAGCEGKLTHRKVGGRTAYYCPAHQS
ncbi:DNA-formamidopyrimidine glycosylase [Erythrobacter sp. QSSC1-22B]|uniref:DNA-formamidopyrimidine glycosylase family protein n=1 Tax=Erythrobacter sp. QSSC1-22B TaxID=1860125 RepID=UPI000804C309|nr:DNA-formamidopyrimidine glycosylase family protein [Erythrobacter sp. QSSC1-22B]OBX18281.1 DNA-formamidopyrimidine glycosylase [Erythrobacter sp. QSSC1-22B]